MKRIPLFFAGLTLSTLCCLAQSAINSGGFNPAGVFQLRIQGGPLQVESSTNLTEWQPLANARGTIADPGSTNAEWRFYRARSGDQFASNVVGFVKVPVEAGKTILLASPFTGPIRLNQPDAREAMLGSTSPEVQISFVQEGQQTAFTFDPLANDWMPAIPEIPAGTPFFLKNFGNQRINVTFTGELPQGRLKRAIPQGEAIVAPLAPKPGPAHEALGAAPVEGAQIKVWNEQTQKYQTSTYDPQARRWIPSLNYKPGRGLAVNYPPPAFQINFTPAR